MDENEIIINVDVTGDADRKFRDIRREMQETEAEAKALSDVEARRAKQTEKLDKQQLERYQRAKQMLIDQGKAMDDLRVKQNKFLEDGGRTRTKGKFDSNDTMLAKFAKEQQKLQAQQSRNLKAMTGYTRAELTRQVKAFQDAEEAKTKIAEKEAAARKRIQDRADVAQARSDAAEARRVAAAEARSKASSERVAAAQQRTLDREAKAAAKAADREAARAEKAAAKLAANEERALAKGRAVLAKSQAEIKSAEDKAFADRTSSAQKFRNDMERILGIGNGGNSGGGHGFFTSQGGKGGGAGRFSRNRFIDFGGRGAQPRTLGMGALVGLAAMGAGPIGVAAGGLAGAAPGAIVGLASAFAALKMSGIGSVIQSASQIQKIQNQIKEGVTKEAKGRAQIRVIMDGLSASQKKGLDLWKGYQAVTTAIGDQVQGVLLPAFGNLGNMLKANAPIIAKSVVGAGGTVARLLNQSSSFLSLGQGKKAFAGTAAAGQTFLSGLGGNLFNLEKLFLNVGNASQGFMKKINKMSEGITQGLASWSGSSGGQKNLKDFFAQAALELGKLGGLLRSVGKVLFTVLKDALPYANQFIDALTKIFTEFNKFLNTKQGHNDVKMIFETIKSAIKQAAAAIQFFWPLVKGGLGIAMKAVKFFTSTFGNTVGLAFAAGGAFFLNKFVGVAQGGLKLLAKSLLKLAVTNPWVAAIAGSAILLGVLWKLSQGLKNVHTDANHAADAIRGIFTASQRGKADKADLVVAHDNTVAARGSLGSAVAKLARDQGRFSSATPAQIHADIVEVDRLRAAYDHAKQSEQDMTASVAKDTADRKANEKKAIDALNKSYSDALANNTKTTPGKGGGRAFDPANTVSTVNMAKTKAEISKYFSAIAHGADNFGLRTRLAMQKVNDFVQITGHMPSRKQFDLIMHSTAKEQIQDIKRELGLIKDKTFKIIAKNKEALQSIMAIANAHIGDKNFNIIGHILKPRGGNQLDQALNPSTNPYLNPAAQAGGGMIPGVGGHDTVPAMLRPGEVVLNRAQQYDFGGPEVFQNYFGSRTSGMGRHFAGGGVVGARIIGDSPTSGLVVGRGGAVIGGVGTGSSTKGNTSVAGSSGTPPNLSTPPTGNPEPEWTNVLKKIANNAAGIDLWTNKNLSDTKSYQVVRGQITKIRDLLTKYAIKDDNLAIESNNAKTKSQKRGISNQRHLLDQQRLTADRSLHAEVAIAERIRSAGVADRAHVRLLKQAVFEKVPGYDAYTSIKDYWEGAMVDIAVSANQLPNEDKTGSPNGPRGAVTLKNAWDGLNNQYNAALGHDQQTAMDRVNYLKSLVQQLNGHPKYQRVVSAELMSDQNDYLSMLGQDLASTLQGSNGPGGDITGSGSGSGSSSDSWGDQPLTKAFQGFIAGDVAQAALATLDGNQANWQAAMNDEATQYFGRISDLRGVMDNPAYAQWRGDILSEITDDVSGYQTTVQAIKDGWAAAIGNGSTDNGEQQQIADVLAASQQVLSQINVGSASERESLSILTDYLASQVPSHEVGARYVGKTGLATIHQGEMITPRGDVRQGDYGSGGVITIDGTGKLGKMLAAHMSYEQGQSARQRARERRR